MKIIIYTDGGSRGNPGVAGSGSVLYDGSASNPLKAPLKEIAYVVGQKSSNNVAEYYGLVKGLEAARELGATEVEVYMDSKLVVEQMSGRWKIKHPDMKQLASNARAIASGFDSVSYTWVPRAKNKKADELSNVAMDAAAAGHEPGVVKKAEDNPEASAAGASSVPPAAQKTSHQTASPAHWHGHDAVCTRFVLLRHGQTQHSVEKRYSGSSNPSLTPEGERQAARAAAAVAKMGSVDVIVASPAQRAQQTARACAQALAVPFERIETVGGLREVDFGAFEGLTRDEALTQYPQECAAWQGSTTQAPPAGESLTALHRRVTRTRLKLQEKYAGKTVLVVTHMSPIKSLIRQALQSGPDTFRHIFLDLASLSVVEFYGDTGVVRCVNDVAHFR